MGGDAVQRLVDIDELRQLRARYWRCLDTKDWPGFRSVFTDDFHFEADGYVGDGADDIVAFLAKALEGSVTVHQGHASEITITGPDTATGVWSFSDWVEHAPTAKGVPRAFRGAGHYNDDYVRTAQGWKLARSIVTRLRVDPVPVADERL